MSDKKEGKRMKITEEMGEQKKWYEEAHFEKMNLTVLPAFLDKLMTDYEHDYGTICHALTAGAIATIWSMNREPGGGITGFQAGAIMWEFVQHWMKWEGPLKMLQLENMLYPQKADKFEKTIAKSTWDWLQAKAKKKLGFETHAHETVKAHWQSIVDGMVPFGYTVIEDE